MGEETRPRRWGCEGEAGEVGMEAQVTCESSATEREAPPLSRAATNIAASDSVLAHVLHAADGVSGLLNSTHARLGDMEVGLETHNVQSLDVVSRGYDGSMSPRSVTRTPSLRPSLSATFSRDHLPPELFAAPSISHLSTTNIARAFQVAPGMENCGQHGLICHSSSRSNAHSGTPNPRSRSGIVQSTDLFI